MSDGVRAMTPLAMNLLALALALVADEGAAFRVPARQDVSASASLRGFARAGALPSLPSFCLRAGNARRPESAVAARAEAPCSRRNVLVGTAAAFATGRFAPAADAAQLPPGETQADGVGERVRKAASKMPGMGPPDVVYPDGVLGRWRVQRVLADVDFPQGTSKADARLAEAMLARRGRADAFAVRFITGKGGVVADREFNMRSLAAASEGVGVDVQWKPSNPNLLTVQYPDGQLRETKVTKRATTLDREAQTLEWSEYSRIADLATGGALEGRGGVPTISARWVRSRFRVVAPSRAEALTLEYFLPTGSADPAAATMKLKYRLLFEREKAMSAADDLEDDGEEEEE